MSGLLRKLDVFKNLPQLLSSISGHRMIINFYKAAELPGILTPCAYLTPGRAKYWKVLDAFIEGSGGEIETDLSRLHRDRLSVFYGVTRDSQHLYAEVVRDKLPFVYIDNGYINSRHEGGDNYAVTVGAERHDGRHRESHDSVAYLKYDLDFKNLHDPAGHVLVCLQSSDWYEKHGTSTTAWLREILSGLSQRLPGAHIRIRPKPDLRTGRGIRHCDLMPLWDGSSSMSISTVLQQDLRGCKLVVTHSSNAGLRALMAGIPVLASAKCHLSPLSLAWDQVGLNLAPPSRDRVRKWLNALLNGQWTLGQLRSGQCWRELWQRTDSVD